MRRRTLLLLPFASCLRADAAGDAYDLLTRLAAALSQGDAIAFIASLDRAMPSFEKLRGYVTALAEQSNVLSSIEVLRQAGDDKRQELELDWFLQISEKQENGPLLRRRERVTVKVERQARKWKVVALDPVEFFAPLRPGAAR